MKMKKLISALIIALFAASAPAADYSDPLVEAQLIALELSGELTPPADLTQQVLEDLAAIRAAYPQVAHISYRLPFSPDQIIVGITQQAMQQFQNGQYHALDELNATYGVVEIATKFDRFSLKLKFDRVYNTQLLCQIYSAANLDGVRYVEPDYTTGDGPTIVAQPPTYTFIDAWGDCPSGCIHHEYWYFKVEAGQVTLLNTCYVDAVNGDNKNTGVAPETALKTIQRAIDIVRQGSTVIVLPGTYTGPGNRDLDFNWKAITLRSTDPNDPNIVQATVIDCNGAESEPHRGFYFHNGEDANSIVDGLTIKNGYAVSYRGGGGIRCDDSSPTIKNCTFTQNSTHYSGGGIYCDDSSPTIKNCTFSQNSADSSGGGIYCWERSSPTIRHCTFSENSASYGGAIECETDRRISGPTIENSTFTGNSAGRGGAIRCTQSAPSIRKCTFIQNSAESGAAISFIGLFPSNSVIADSIFTQNSALETGGALCLQGSSTTIINCINCIFTENSAGAGGGLDCRGAILVLKNCAFGENSADYTGGAMYASSLSATIENCTFTANSADYGGALGCSFIYTALTIRNSTFTQNVASGNGGGLLLFSSDATLLKNCTFTANSAGGHGGGVSMDGGLDFIVENCTFTENSASRAGALFCWTTLTTLDNCILWGNTAADGYEILLKFAPDSIYNVDYCNIKGGLSGIYNDRASSTINWGPGNIDVDPCFVSPGYWDPNGTPTDANDDFWVEGDYHLLPGSSCINAGDPNYIPQPNETDLDGLPRVIGGRIDMGAYEFNHCPIAIAGPNQITYAFIDGLADVTLDGSASYDDDNDVLDYYWSWIIDSNLYEANGVSPTIQLPIGRHEIELIVDDGIDESESDYCTVTVIEPLEASLWFLPNSINCNARPQRILAILQLPSDIEPDDVSDEPLTIYPYDIQSQYNRAYKWGRGRYARTMVMAVFDRNDICDALQTPGRHQLKIAGRLTTGQYFYGTDTIRIVIPRPRPWPFHRFYRSH